MTIHDQYPPVWSVGHYDYKLEFADLLPPLPDDALAELEADIAAHGIAVPVLVTDDDVVVDGYYRLAIALKLGIEAVPRRSLGELTLDQARDRAIATNVHRRQLNRDERRALIAKMLIATPDKSDRTIANMVGADHKTVGVVRDKLEASGEIPQLNERRGRDGKTRPAKKDGTKDASAVKVGRLGELEEGDAVEPEVSTPNCNGAQVNSFGPRNLVGNTWDLKHFVREVGKVKLKLERMNFGKGRKAADVIGEVQYAADWMIVVLNGVLEFIENQKTEPAGVPT
jgi:hypothetical protein